MRRLTSIVGVLLSLLACSAAWADSVALGENGIVYTGRVGRYGSFFPRGGAYDGDAVVLAIEIRKPDGTRTFALPPGGETVAVDADPFLVWEETSKRLFVVWEGLATVHSTVRLASFDGAEWSDSLQISGNPFTQKSSPRLAITRETYVRDLADETVTGVRTTLHVVWYEDDYGDVHILYAPVVLDNGFTPKRLPPIFDLGTFVPEETAAGAAPSAALLRNPRVVAGADQKSVLVALADDATDQIATLRIEMLPDELSAVADAIEEFFDDQANDPCSADASGLAERARAHLVVIGTRFSAYARSYMADAMREWLLASRSGECSQGGRAALAERARAHLVVIGRRALREVIVSAQEESSYLLTFSTGADANVDLALALQKVTTTPPAIGGGAARIHVGGAGRQTLVSWRAGSQLHYQEHDGTEWLPRQTLALTDSFTLEQAYAVLDGKVR